MDLQKSFRSEQLPYSKLARNAASGAFAARRTANPRCQANCSAAANLKIRRDPTISFSCGNGIPSEPREQFRLSVNGKAFVDFDVALSDKTWQSADGKVRIAYSVMENNARTATEFLLWM